MSDAPQKPSPDIRGLPRFLAATVVVALLYIGLQEAWVAAGHSLVQRGWAPSWVLAGNQENAAKRIATDSAAREAALTPMHRRAAFLLGFNVGYAAGGLGAAATWNESARAQMKKVLEPREQAAKQLATFLGTGDVTPLRAETPADNLRLPAAIDADENGLASRVETATTPRHKELYLLGAHVGVIAAEVDLAALQGNGIWPVPPLAIARHATLAGVPRDLWSPLQQVAEGGPPNQTADRYRAAVTALDQALDDPRTLGAAAGEPTR